ncbi:MAG: nucleoside triphosphate pyrophosphohydrolase [Lachnospira sp.]|nr:nucleoside triphosphate pyrophosphohydrolase [Lachnospira sp.]
MKVYNKLVRDKIPEIIEADGKECKTRILSNDEYIAALEAKLNEEVAEYQADKNLEEMADVLEVLQAICTARGYSLEELELTREKKAQKRGGFKEKIFLEYVEEKM